MLAKNSRLRLAETARSIFMTPVHTWRHCIVVLCVALAFILMPQRDPVDWNLNTEGYWSAFPNSYADPAKVYPPWGLILMLPYYWMRAEGARVASVLVIGWLAFRRHWTLSRFLAAVLSPYFLTTMSKSNMDIFVFVLPLLLWEAAEGTRWQSLGRGTAMSLSLLKPQGSLFIWGYWLWCSRKRWKDLIWPLGIVALVTLPISLIGSPPLIWQWMQNLLNPSSANAYYWSVNNLSLTSKFGVLPGALIFFLAASVVGIGVWRGWIRWSRDHVYAALLFSSFFLLPYASQQSSSSAFTLIPSWPSFLMQWVGILLGFQLDYWDYIPLYVLFFATVSMFLYIPRPSPGTG
ncbi:MAG TPA: hypothetical protein ENJ31_02175 [Anaerolineae bacterium]|nr:hypothetical protein [Anaerolineae bacterium]